MQAITREEGESLWESAQGPEIYVCDLATGENMGDAKLKILADGGAVYVDEHDGYARFDELELANLAKHSHLSLELMEDGTGDEPFTLR